MKKVLIISAVVITMLAGVGGYVYFQGGLNGESSALEEVIEVKTNTGKTNSGTVTKSNTGTSNTGSTTKTNTGASNKVVSGEITFDRQDCSGLEGMRKGMCDALNFSKESIAKRDISICEHLDTEYLKGACYNNVVLEMAKTSRNSTACSHFRQIDGIDLDLMKQSCEKAIEALNVTQLQS